MLFHFLGDIINKNSLFQVFLPTDTTKCYISWRRHVNYTKM